MREKIEELETEKNMYKAKYEKCIHDKRIVERELSSGDSIRNELRNWEQWGQLLFRQINDETAVVSASVSSSSSSSSSNSSNLMKNLNDSSQSNESDFLELNDLMTQSGAVGKKKRKLLHSKSFLLLQMMKLELHFKNLFLLQLVTEQC